MSDRAMGKAILNPTADGKEDFANGAIGTVEVGQLRTDYG
jgi:hypothetical protein